MKVIITGAKGQLGSDLVPLARSAGFEVVPFSSADLDITDKAGVMARVDAVRPVVIINCGAYTKVDLAEKEEAKAFAVNQDGAANLADAAASVKAVLVHVSTDFVFDGARPHPYTESDATNPLGVYGASKLAGEAEIQKRLESHVIVRTSWLYGVNGGNFVKTMLRLASEREGLRVVYDQTGSPTWSADLASALVAITLDIKAGNKHWGLYHYSNEGVASWYDLAVAVVEESRRLGLPIKCNHVEPILTAQYPTPAKRPPYSVFDKALIKKSFGLKIPNWRVSLKDMMNMHSERVRSQASEYK
mgnify:FL=1